MHLSTSPIPVLGAADESLAALGLGEIAAYLIPDGLWLSVAPPNFEQGHINKGVLYLFGRVISRTIVEQVQEQRGPMVVR